jgi:acyl-homoserine-lactone acylase
VLEAYARGVDLYAYQHPGEVDARLLPFTGRDVAAGFAHKLPFLVGVAFAMKKIRGGSNAHAVSSTRSADGITRLDINSHQPWEGPVS